MSTAVATSPTYRAATPADLPRLCELFDHFCKAGAYAQHNRANPAVYTSFIAQLVAHADSVVIVHQQGDRLVGMIGVSVMPYPYSGEPIASELFWWLEPEVRGGGAGTALLGQAEQWAHARGATHLLMIAPTQSPGVDRIYQAMGYTPLETTWQKPMTWFALNTPDTPIQYRRQHGIVVHDDVLSDPYAYRAMALKQLFQVVSDGAVTFQRIAPCADPALPMWIAHMYPRLTPTLSVFRQSPHGQVEPNDVHTDAMMGDWTALYYLTPDPPEDDGTLFWQHTATGLEHYTYDHPSIWPERDDCVCWHRVQARFNRLVIFPATLLHSRAMPENYGTGDDARLQQVVFGTGAL